MCLFYGFSFYSKKVDQLQNFQYLSSRSEACLQTILYIDELYKITKNRQIVIELTC